MSKPWYRSKGIIGNLGGIAAAVVILAQTYGFLEPGEAAAWTALLAASLGLWGRIVANAPIRIR